MLSLPRTDPSRWFRRTRWQPGEDGLYEGLFALSSGRTGLRASVDLEHGGGYPGCYRHDVYAPGTVRRREIANVFHAAFWTLRLDGLPLSPGAPDVRPLAFEQCLDVETAAVRLRLVLAAEGATIEIEATTLVPAADPDLVLTFFRARQEGERAAEVELLTGLDWRWGNGAGGDAASPRRVQHLRRVERRREGGVAVVSAAVGGRSLAAAVVHQTSAGVGARPLDGATSCLEALRAEGPADWTAVRCTALATASRRRAAEAEAIRLLEGAQREGLQAVVDRHVAAWRERWAGAGWELDAPAEDVEAFRFALFHLLQAPDRTAPATNVPARGLTSQHHSGHVFFNSDLFLVPFYSHLEPAVARSLVRHRVRGLGRARAYARREGLPGARYPTRCDLAGRPDDDPRAAPCDGGAGDAAAEPGAGGGDRRALHLSADVLYGLARYRAITGDEAILDTEGRRMVAEIAAYYAAAAETDDRRGGRGLRAALCFDELHGPVDHHYGTNVLAAWALRWAADHLDDAPEEWRRIAEQIVVEPPVAGLVPQFPGYLALPDEVVALHPGHRLPIRRGGGRGDTQILKQADVVLVHALLPAAASPAERRASWRYYDRRTLHASSLSPGPHALVAARVGEVESARHWILAGLRYDLDFRPRDGNANGVHLGGYAAAFLAVVEGVLGLTDLPATCGSPHRAAFDPRLPRSWRRLRCRVRWRGVPLEIEAEPGHLRVRGVGAPERPVPVEAWGASGMISSTETLEFARADHRDSESMETPA